MNQFITAVVRKERWADIAQSEFDRYEKQYFPQAGDSKEQIAKKQQARESAIYTMLQQAGKTESWESWAKFYLNNRKSNESAILWDTNNVNISSDPYER